MKAVPCKTPDCKAKTATVGRRVVGYGMLMLPDGQPYLLSRPMSFPVVSKCSGCNGWTRLPAAEFARLPTLTVAQLRILGHLDALTKDWRGDGLTHSQASDMIGAGMMGPGDPGVPK